ncbi:ATP-dependent DNA helicase [Atractiella rhizophila]|nr:ATP-dependent DNA helicase [Atractiella rhizophila]
MTSKDRDEGGMREEYEELMTEIASVESQIADLQELLPTLKSRATQLKRYLTSLSFHPVSAPPPQRATKAAVSYPRSQLLSKARQLWGINSFRLCQEDVINSVLEGNDTVVVMPTGGGKSLTYQLPAIFLEGTTLVVSPLLSLIMDQVHHLENAGINAVALTGTTDKDEAKRIGKEMVEDVGEEIKLCYVTPERIAGNKGFMNTLTKMYGKNKLSRIVIDEAHCCSQMGHDYRPDYRKLSKLRTLFPEVPIIALTATLPSPVLSDLLDVLGLAPIGKGTAFFSSPLYRPNLNYSVMSKPQQADAVIKKLVEWVEDNHSKETGIVYCLTQKDSETVAAAIAETSEGRIKTGVYHAALPDGEKERIHEHWRDGKVQVVCATIAFGLGIDAARVRWVVHHSLPKSLEGYYQESGRAGRDGNTSDCVLLWRGQDAFRVLSIICDDRTGTEKLWPMIRYAQDLSLCRKKSFAAHFGREGSGKSVAAFERAGNEDADCGHCDNCLRGPSSFQEKDVTLESWRILRCLQQVENQGGRVTFSQLIDLVRGLGGGVVSTGNGNQKTRLNIEAVAGSKVTLSKDATERVVLNLLVNDFLKVEYQATAYSVNVYLKKAPGATRLLRFTRQDIEKAALGEEVRGIVRIVLNLESAELGRGRTSAAKGKGQEKKRKREEWESDDMRDRQPSVSTSTRKKTRRAKTSGRKTETDHCESEEAPSASVRKSKPSELQKAALKKTLSRTKKPNQDIVELDDNSDTLPDISEVVPMLQGQGDERSPTEFLKRNRIQHTSCGMSERNKEDGNSGIPGRFRHSSPLRKGNIEAATSSHEAVNHPPAAVAIHSIPPSRPTSVVHPEYSPPPRSSPPQMDSGDNVLPMLRIPQDRPPLKEEANTVLDDQAGWDRSFENWFIEETEDA